MNAPKVGAVLKLYALFSFGGPAVHPAEETPHQTKAFGFTGVSRSSGRALR